MLRSWLLMTYAREGSPTAWADRLKKEASLAVLAGFTPGQTPCATAHIDFLKRLSDGPYAARKQQDVPLSQQLKGWHTRRLDDATKHRAAAADAAGKTQSGLLADTLLEQAELPLDPHDLQTRLDQIFVELGLKLTLDAGLLSSEVTVAGDGTAEPTGASSQGQRACACPAGSKCGCQRNYTSATAQWCYDTQHGWTFGDRSYTISVHLNGHDFPLMTILPGGNETDFTLSLKALDRLLKLLEDLDTPLQIRLFIGDGHHNAMGIYRYLKDKGIIPIIPLDEDEQPSHARAKPSEAKPSEAKPSEAKPSEAKPSETKPSETKKNTKAVTPLPQIEMYPDIIFEPDGTPLCPGNCRMRHQSYDSRKAAHCFACPCTRKNGKQEWVFYAEECPFHRDCTPPEKKMGHTLYIKSEADLRLFPPIPRDSKRFNDLYAHRSGTERQNAVADSYQVDGRHRNGTFTLIRLTFVNICKHARIRQKEGGNKTSQAHVHEALGHLGLSSLLPN
ncbi:MAG: hypothetical protein GY930_06440 [bacterium]|nr:hypothetical protein [bacterium]